MDDREGVARAYYAALDDHEYDRLTSLLAPSFAHYRPDRTIDGRDRFVRFMRDERPMTDTSHPIDAVYRAEEELAVRGRLLDADGERITGFVDVFSFDGDVIEEIRTYSNG